MIIPCTMHFAVLIAIRAEGEPIDYALEPIIAWSVTADMAAQPHAITLRGQHLLNDPIMRPDESVRFNGVDYPDFAAFLHAMREPFGVPVEFAVSETRLDNQGNPIRPVPPP